MTERLYTSAEATCHVWPSADGYRWCAKWHAAYVPMWYAIQASFRANVERHGKAMYRPAFHLWMLPCSEDRQLGAWLARTFAPGAVVWHEASDPPGQRGEEIA